VVHVPTWSIKEWKETWTTIWNDRKLRLLPDRRTVILGYPYTRPSRPRCGLYFYREAIRAATTLWSTKSSTPSVCIEINSDLQLSRRTFAEYTRVLEWGESTRQEEFLFFPGKVHCTRRILTFFILSRERFISLFIKKIGQMPEISRCLFVLMVQIWKAKVIVALAMGRS
jgi:hypothetical protein